MNDYSHIYFYDESVRYYLEKHELFLSINPVKVKDYIIFYSSIDCLTINKNRIPDINVIKMSYLEFIYKTIMDNINNSESHDYSESQMLIKFISLISLCLDVEDKNINFLKYSDGELFLTIDNYVDFTGKICDRIEISTSQFDEIKKIICEYHMVQLPDETIDPKLESALEEARAYKMKNEEKMGSLEDQFCCLMISASLNMNDIKSLTIRKFQKILERVDYKLHYQLYKTAEMNGVEFKQKINHWMSEIKNDRYSGLLVDYDSTVDKFTKNV